MLLELSLKNKKSILVNIYHIVSIEPNGSGAKVIMVNSDNYIVTESVGIIQRELLDLEIKNETEVLPTSQEIE